MSITLNTKTYNYSGHTPQQLSVYTERSSGVATGFSNLTNRVEDGNNSSGAKTKVRWKLKVPVVQAAESECACPGDLLREAIVDLVITFDPRASATERTDMLDRLQDLVLTTEFIGSVTNLVQPSA